MAKVKTTIGVTTETYQRLSRVGRFGDTLEDIINRLLDHDENEQAVIKAK